MKTNRDPWKHLPHTSWILIGKMKAKRWGWRSMLATGVDGENGSRADPSSPPYFLSSIAPLAAGRQPPHAISHAVEYRIPYNHTGIGFGLVWAVLI
jgi:hypothetical protein